MLQGMTLLKRCYDNVWEYDDATGEVYIYNNRRMPELCDQKVNYETLYTIYRKQFICEEDIDRWQQYMSVQSLHRFLQSGKTQDHFFVRSKHGEQDIEWHEGFLERSSETVVLIGSMDINQAQRDMFISKAVLPEFDYVGRINLATSSYVLYYSDDVRGPVPPSESNDYNTTMAQYQQRAVVPEKYQQVCENMRLENVVRQLETQDEYVLYYSIIKDSKNVARKKIRFCYADAEREELLIARTDVTRESFLTDELQKSREEMKRILETTTSLVFQYYPVEGRVSLNQLGEEAASIAVPEEEMIQQLVITGHLEASCAQPVSEALWEVGEGKKHVAITIRARKMIELPWSWYRMVLFDYKDEMTQERRVLGYLQNIDQDVLEQDELRRKAQTDSLTGLFNAGAGRQNVKEILKQQGERDIGYNAMFVMDIDDFKQVNDTLGHMSGDDTLRCFARVLKETFRSEDIIYRLGGDEFVVFAANMQEYKKAIEVVMERFTRQMSMARKQYPLLSASVGIFVSNTTRDYQRYYQEADAALYETKRNGKNHYTMRIATREELYCE